MPDQDMQIVGTLFRAVWGIFKLFFYIIRMIYRWTRYLIFRYRISGVKEYHAINTSRFEHTLIVGGSGHGKTQLIQSLILLDLQSVINGKQSVIVMDSQGDMINKILSLAALAPDQPLATRLVLIDPTDVQNPPCLNLFDFGLARAKEYAPLERETLINSAVAMYEYIFSALLGAELTNRQGIIFRFIGKLMMQIPDATIFTLMDFMEDPELVKPHLGKLDVATQRFFLTQFFSSAFDQTRQQILSRLWGVLAEDTLGKMFSHKENKLNLFEAMNNGSLILINTAKSLLQQEGCELFGRFMIALLVQATQERSAIPTEKRTPTFVYIDEAPDYFDNNLELLLNTARKYNVGIILAAQNLGQFNSKLLQTVLSSTSIKYAGGVSNNDANVLAREMNRTPDDIMSLRKTATQSYFALYDKNLTTRTGDPPTAYVVDFGEMEHRPKMTVEQREKLIEDNRARFCAAYDPSLLLGSQAIAKSGVQFNLEEPRVL